LACCARRCREFITDEEEQGLLGEAAAQLALALYAGEQEVAHERAQVSAQLATEQHRAIVEATGSWIATFDAHLRVSYWNPAAETISGYSMIEVLGSAEVWEPLFPNRRYRLRVLEEFEQVVHGGQKQALETMVVAKDGSQKLVAWSIMPLAGGGGEPVGGLLAGQDVTEQRTAWTPTRRRPKTDEAVTTANAAVLVHDLDGQFCEANELACETLGYSRLELLDMKAAEVLTLEDQSGATEWKEALLAVGRVTFETVARRKGGEVVPVEVTMHLLGNRGAWQAMDIVRQVVPQTETDVHEFEPQAESQA
jgi:PAS domain S-box-containing protein